MALLKFLKGNYNSLSSATITEGQVLICGDTGEMFVDVAADKRVKIGDFVVVSNLAALEALDASAVPTSRLYYVEDGNILARSNGTIWVQINKQKTLAELGGISKSVYDTKIAALESADKTNSDAIANVETRLQTAENKLKSVATTEGLGELSDTIAEHTDSINIMKGDVNTEGSMLKIAKDAADAKDIVIQAAQSAANKAQSDVDALTQTHTTDKSALEAAIALKANINDVYNKGNIDSKVDTINLEIAKKADATDVYTQAQIDEMIENLEAADLAINNIIGDVTEGKTIVEMISDVESTSTYDDSEVRGLIDTNIDAIAKEIDDREGAISDLRAELEGDIATKVEQSVYDEKVTALEDKDEELAGLINGNAADIEELGTEIDTLVGSDTGKSVRTIANEELATQLIAENAAEALDTLHEIATWIQEHPEDASAMNADIETLQAKVDTDNQTVSEYVAGVVESLNIGDYATVEALNSATDRIDDLETASSTHATKDELKIVSDELDTYKQTHNGDYDNDTIDSKVKGIQDQIDVLDRTYATDAQLTAAINAEVERTNGVYATQATMSTHIDNTDVHVTTSDKTKWNASEQNAKDYADNQIDDAKTVLQDYADQAELDAIAAAKAETETQVAAEATIARAAEQANATAISNEVTAREQAVSAVQGNIDTVSGALNTYKTENNAVVALKANAADVYTKAEVESLLAWSEF